MTTQSIQTPATEPQHGSEIIVPLNRLKASDKNARKTPHSPATIEAFDFRIFSGQTEFGAAWKKTSRENREYLSVTAARFGKSSAGP